MAIAPVGTPGVYENAASTAAVIPVPAGVAAGHRLVAVVEHSNVAAIATPAGWSLDAARSATASIALAQFSRVATSSEPASYTFPTSATAGRVSGLMVALSGVDATTWLDATPTTVAASGSSATVPALTTVTDGAFLLTAYGINASSSTDGVTPTGFTELARNAATGSGVGRRLVLAQRTLSPAGTTGTVQWVTSPSSSLAQAAMLTPYRPASGGGGTTPTAPTAAFTGTPLTGVAPLAVAFTDASTGSPTSWAWDFGDVTTSTAQNPSKTYTAAGTYTVTLTATNATGSNTLTRTGYVTATSGAVAPTLAWRAVGEDGAVSVSTANAVSVRLRASTDAASTAGLIYSPAATPTAQGISKPKLSGLTPGVRYYYRVGMTDTAGAETWDTKATVGRIRVAPAPGAVTSFVAYQVACCNSSDSAAMAAIATRDDGHLIFHRGDKFYDDDGDASLAGYRTSLTAKQAAPNHEAVYATTQELYSASDHDASKKNNGNAASYPANVANFLTAYDELYATPARPAGTYYAKMWGRVLVLNLDSRSFPTAVGATDNSSKTLLGATQKQWVKDQITGTTAGLVVLLGDAAWIGTAAAGDDAWLGYTTERAELAAFIVASGKRVAYLAGDMHALAADTGANSPGGIPVFQSAPLNNAASQKGGPYSSGPYPSGTGTVQQYARLVFTDDGTTITLDWTGYSSDGTQRLAQTSTFAPTQATASAVTLTPTTVTAAPVTVAPTSGPSSVTLTPTTVTAAPVALGVGSGPVSVVLTPTGTTASPVALTPTARPAAVTLTPTQVTAAPQAVAPASVALPAVPSAVTLTPTGTTATPAVLTPATPPPPPAGGAVLALRITATVREPSLTAIGR